jgi:hypothetical protein
MRNILVLSMSLFIGSVNAQTIPSYIPSEDLVAWYPFNGNANDESGNGNNGTVNGATLTTDKDGNENSAYSFDGNDDIIDLPELDNKIGTPGYSTTYSFWFKTLESNNYGNMFLTSSLKTGPS